MERRAVHLRERKSTKEEKDDRVNPKPYCEEFEPQGASVAERLSNYDVRPHLIPRVDLGARGDEQTYDLRASAGSCEVEGRAVPAAAERDRGLLVQQPLHDGRVASFSGSKKLFLRANLRRAREQRIRYEGRKSYNGDAKRFCTGKCDMA